MAFSGTSGLYRAANSQLPFFFRAKPPFRMTLKLQQSMKNQMTDQPDITAVTAPEMAFCRLLPVMRLSETQPVRTHFFSEKHVPTFILLSLNQ